jgi:hypothetical protein
MSSVENVRAALKPLIEEGLVCTVSEGNALSGYQPSSLTPPVVIELDIGPEEDPETYRPHIEMQLAAMGVAFNLVRASRA